jgi:hypothetical protein
MKPMNLNLTISRHAAGPLVLVALLIAGGCSSMGNREDAESVEDPMKVAEQQCRPGMKLECYERTGQPTRCTCITAEELERVLTDFIH